MFSSSDLIISIIIVLLPLLAWILQACRKDVVLVFSVLYICAGVCVAPTFKSPKMYKWNFNVDWRTEYPLHSLKWASQACCAAPTAFWYIFNLVGKKRQYSITSNPASKHAFKIQIIVWKFYKFIHVRLLTTSAQKTISWINTLNTISAHLFAFCSVLPEVTAQGGGNTQ